MSGFYVHVLRLLLAAVIVQALAASVAQTLKPPDTEALAATVAEKVQLPNVEGLRDKGNVAAASAAAPAAITPAVQKRVPILDETHLKALNIDAKLKEEQKNTKKTMRVRHKKRDRRRQHSISSLVRVSQESPKETKDPKEVDDPYNQRGALQRGLSRMAEITKSDVDYGTESWSAISAWFRHANPLGDGPWLLKVLFLFLMFLLLAGPILLREGIYYTFKVQTWKSPLAVRIRTKTRLLFTVWCVLQCFSWVVDCIREGLTHGTDLLDDLFSVLRFAHWTVAGVVVTKSLGFVDESLMQVVTEQVASADFRRRRAFIDTLKYGQGVAVATNSEAHQDAFIYTYIWRSFYFSTCFVVVIAALCVGIGKGLNGYPLVLTLCYLVYTLCITVFGARTMGPQLYGGLWVCFNRPFQEGDIITLDSKSGGGGGSTNVERSVVTGFVEHVGLLATVVRRFDMRCVWVPNSMFIDGAVSNWGTRPRKLISLEFATSYRIPPELCQTFQEKLLFIVKNHAEVDQTQYLKVALRGLKKGAEYQLICFTARGASKKKVQQNILIRIMKLARLLGITVVFGQQSLYVEREEVANGGHYIGEPKMPQAGEAPNLEEVLPEKKPFPRSATAAAKGILVVEIGQIFLQPGNLKYKKSCKFLVCVEAKIQRNKLKAKRAEVWTRDAPLLEIGDELEAEYFEKLVFDLERPTKAIVLPKTVRVQVVHRSDLNEAPLGFADAELKDQVLKEEMMELDLRNGYGAKVGRILLNVFAPPDMVDKFETGEDEGNHSSGSMG